MTLGHKMDGLENYPFKTEPYDFQRKVLGDSLECEHWAYFMEMGTGKSKVAIDNFAYHFLKGNIDTVVIFAKKGEYATWVYQQLPEHLPDCIRSETVLFSTTRAKSKDGKKKIDSLMQEDTSRLRVLVVNVEALITDSCKKVLMELYKTSDLGVFLVVDESTCVKHPKSKRSKQAYIWASMSKYRRIMTGTPMTQSPLDLWGQCLILGRGLLGSRSFYAFRGMFANLETLYLGNRTVQKVSGYKNLDMLTRIISKFSTILTKDECLDLPPKVYSKRFVEMTKRQEELYTQLKEQAILELDGIDLEVTNVLAMITKLHQIACGQLKVSDREYVSVENNRIQTLLDLVEDYEGKVIVWANYRQTIIDVVEVLQKQYGVEAVAPYFGGVSDKSRVEAVQRFQDPADPLKFFVANPQSGGYGLTLTAANLVIYYSNSFNLEHRLQSEDRAHRIGQEHKVTYIDLVVPGTVDEHIIKLLRQKKNLMDEVLRSNDIRGWI